MGPRLYVCDGGTMPYGEALALQRGLARARISGALDEDLLLLVEHPPVVTYGRSARDRNLTVSPALLQARGIELHEVERGGDITFHGPGQLVGYPIVDLKRHRKDLHWYLRQVEEALILALRPLGIEAGRSAGYTGVWTEGRKLASIGVHARDWVVWHGFALNVTTDLSYFDIMVPCGIADVVMTSVAAEVSRAGHPTALTSDLAPRVRGEVSTSFAGTFGLQRAHLALAEVLRVAAVVQPA